MPKYRNTLQTTSIKAIRITINIFETKAIDSIILKYVRTHIKNKGNFIFLFVRRHKESSAIQTMPLITLRFINNKGFFDGQDAKAKVKGTVNPSRHLSRVQSKAIKISAEISTAPLRGIRGHRESAQGAPVCMHSSNKSVVLL